MEKRKFKNLNITSSVLGFGCMRFPTTPEDKIDEPLAESMLDYAFQKGVTYFDTAVPYHRGESESFVGRVLEKYPRDSYLLATKLPPWQVKERADVRRIFDAQRKKMQKDFFDFYLLHSLDKEEWRRLKDLGAVEECEALQKEGKIRYFGFSFHDDYDAFEEIVTARKWDFCQLQINYMDKNEQAGLKGLALAEKLGVPVIVMEPVKGGQLAKLPEAVKEPLESICPEASDASWAMRWVASQPNVAVILSGMSTMEQIEDNIRTFSNFQPLTETEFAAIDDVADALRKRVKNGCTACRYCMPCPAGVDIPANFSVWNSYGMYQNEMTAKNAIHFRLPAEKQAKNCVGCGKCESICPQKIAIRQDLALAQQDFDRITQEK